MIRLNLGCGNDYKKGYTNIDHDPRYCQNGVDIIADIRCMPFEPNSVDEIIAEGCIEHLSYRDWIPTALHWFNILKPGGNIIIETPNLETVIKDYMENPGFIECHAFETLWGGQRNTAEYHMGLLTQNNLYIILTAAGFQHIEIEKATKNLNKENWNLRMKAIKLYESNFPACAKGCCNPDIKIEHEMIK